MPDPSVRRASLLLSLACVLAGLLALTLALAARDTAVQDQGPVPRRFSITLRRYAFVPARIEVVRDDVVQIELTTEDIAHSWTVDEYRIAKRVGPEHPVTFEFRADKAGTFPFYCNLQTEEGCRQMRGELIVKARR